MYYKYWGYTWNHMYTLYLFYEFLFIQIAYIVKKKRLQRGKSLSSLSSS